MRALLTGSLALAALAAATVLLAGGCSRPPMTSSEFVGFCSSAGGDHNQCDGLELCRDYLTTVGEPQKDLRSCLEGCAEVHKRESDAQRGLRCMSMLTSGNDWCERYCRSLFPQ